MYQSKKRAWLPWVVLLAVVLVVVWLFHALGNILTPFIVAAVLAYILNPLVEKLRDKGMKRGPAAMLVMVFALVVLFGLMLIIVPMLVNQFNNLVSRLPQLAGYVQNQLLPWLSEHTGKHIVLNGDVLAKWLQSHMGSFQTALQKVVPTLMRQSGALAMGISNVFLLPLLLYYFLLDWQRWTHGIRALIPRRYIDVYMRISRNMDQVLGEFMRGQLMVMLIMGCVYGVGLMLTGLDSGFAIGMIAGLLVFIPYLGAFTGLLLATVAAVLQFNEWSHLLIVWGVFALGQFTESFFVTPKIVGDRIGLSPFWVIFSLMAFGQLMGFVGMLIGLPLAAVCLVLLREGSDAYFNSRFYQRQK